MTLKLGQRRPGRNGGSHSTTMTTTKTTATTTGKKARNDRSVCCPCRKKWKLQNVLCLLLPLVLVEIMVLHRYFVVTTTSTTEAGTEGGGGGAAAAGATAGAATTNDGDGDGKLPSSTTNWIPEPPSRHRGQQRRRERGRGRNDNDDDTNTSTKRIRSTPLRPSSFKDQPTSATSTSDAASGNKNDDSNNETKNTRFSSLPPSDGTFNGYPIYRIDGVQGFNGKKSSSSSSSSTSTSTSSSSPPPLFSQMHCIGETWHPPIWYGRRKTYLDVSWYYRSCHFEFFCYDARTQEFVVYLEEGAKTNDNDNNATRGAATTLQQQTTAAAAAAASTVADRDVSQTVYDGHVPSVLTSMEGPKSRRPKSSISSNSNSNSPSSKYPYGVSIGSINGKWTLGGIPRLQWFPTVRYGPIPIDSTFTSSPASSTSPTSPTSSSQQQYQVYTLPSSVVMVPFHSLAAFNPGHLVWDDYLPLYTLLQIFDFDHINGEGDGDTSPVDPLLIRYILPPDDNGDTRGLWAGCDWRTDRSEECDFMMRKFAPLMVTHPPAWNITSQKHVDLKWHSNHQNNNNNNNDDDKEHALICARNGLAGIGSLSDHGSEKGHGWDERDYETTFNHGRGGQLWRFRNFMMKNVGVDDPAKPMDPQSPMLIFFSENSSTKSHRSFTFEKEQKALRGALEKRSVEMGLPPVEIQSHQFKRFTIQEQAKMVSQASVYVTACGGGAVTATFLPRGASLLLAYSETGGIENSKWSGKPARLDWDYLNNLSYLRVHWLPQARNPSDRSTPEDIAAFVDLMLHELQTVYRERVRRWQQYQETMQVKQE